MRILGSIVRCKPIFHETEKILVPEIERFDEKEFFSPLLAIILWKILHGLGSVISNCLRFIEQKAFEDENERGGGYDPLGLGPPIYKNHGPGFFESR